MKLEVSEQFVKEAHASACQDWKRRIEEEFPSLFEVKLELNKWYKTKEKGNLVFYRSNESINYGFTYGTNEWYDTLGFPLDYTWELATPQEIESMLWQEAEKRGIGKDTKIECHADGESETDLNLCSYGIKYDAMFDTLFNMHGLIYKCGQWAKPLDPNKEIRETISRLEKELKELKEKVK